MKNIKVRYTHPSKGISVKAGEVYDLDFVKNLCDKYNSNYKKYFTPVEGEWEDYEEKQKRNYKKVEKIIEENEEIIIKGDK